MSKTLNERLAMAEAEGLEVSRVEHGRKGIKIFLRNARGDVAMFLCVDGKQSRRDAANNRATFRRFAKDNRSTRQ